jgi:hypothetical protein
MLRQSVIAQAGSHCSGRESLLRKGVIAQARESLLRQGVIVQADSHCSMLRQGVIAQEGIKDSAQDLGSG